MSNRTHGNAKKAEEWNRDLSETLKILASELIVPVLLEPYSLFSSYRLCNFLLTARNRVPANQADLVVPVRACTSCG